MSNHWHVLGAGAMGCLFAGALADTGNPVTLLLREARCAEGVLRIEAEGKTREFSLPLAATSAAGS